jgi:hypothetical protein
MRRLLLLMPLLALSLLCSCEKSPKIDIVPPADRPLSREVIGYGVVTLSYIHLLDEPDSGGISLVFLRKGTIVKILEHRSVPKGEMPEFWVRAQALDTEGANKAAGWARAEAFQVYDNEEKARTVVEALHR